MLPACENNVVGIVSEQAGSMWYYEKQNCQCTTLLFSKKTVTVQYVETNADAAFFLDKMLSDVLN